MQRADTAVSSRDPGSVTGKDRGITGDKPASARHAVSRRALFAAAAAASVAVAAPAMATDWRAEDWLRRWHRLGCGVSLISNGLELRPRLNGDAVQNGAMLAELALPERQRALVDVLRSVQLSDEDTVVRLIDRARRLDADCITDDEDAVGHVAWQQQREKAWQRVADMPAQSDAGLAAKAGVVLEDAELDADHEAILRSVVRQLERRA